jgi:hypothetical protein
MAQTYFQDPIIRGAFLAGIRNLEATVNFDKADGTRRVMRCTINPALMPAAEQERLVTATPRKFSPDACRVWDLEAMGWRSFRWDSVTGVILHPAANV